jgi:Domain of unknown function (DUF1707)
VSDRVSAIIRDVTEPVRPEDMRVSDDERRAVQDRLQRAHEVGQLELAEFDERVKTVWAARTRGQLQRVTADLPAPPPVPGRAPVFSDTGGGTAMRILTIIWASSSVVNLAVWGLLTLSLDDPLFPWWLLASIPFGLVLVILYIAGIGRPPRD